MQLSLNGSTGSAPAGLQWTLSYAPGDVLSLNTTAGPALTGAGKSVSCNPKSGSVTCEATGMDGNAIGDGVVAVVSVTLTSASASTVSLPISNVMGAQPDGTFSSVSGTGGVVTVGQSGLPTVSALQCSPASLASGAASTCTVTLSKAAPSGGSSVAILSSNAALTVPASVTVASSSMTANFTATAGTVSANQAVTVTASSNGSTATAAVTVTPTNPITVTGLKCTPTTVFSGGSAKCTVTILKAAASGGTAVALSDKSQALTVPATVTVAAGATTADFTATVGPVTADQSVTITATLNGSSMTATLNVKSRGST